MHISTDTFTDTSVRHIVNARHTDTPTPPLYRGVGVGTGLGGILTH